MRCHVSVNQASRYVKGKVEEKRRTSFNSKAVTMYKQKKADHNDAANRYHLSSLCPKNYTDQKELQKHSWPRDFIKPAQSIVIRFCRCPSW